MRLTRRQLNRTLLLRQHLLTRVDWHPHQMIDHLLGLQAQDNLPPYLSLAARLSSFHPSVVSDGLADRTLVRMVVMRGTIHLLTADDALALRGWTQPCQDRERKVSQNTRPGLHLPAAAVAAAVAEVLEDGPLPVKELGEALSAHFPDVPPSVLAHLARVDAPLAQLPPRGQWKASGRVVYQLVDRWVGRPLLAPSPAAVVRRYLAAFGPASSADVGAWSGLSGTSHVLAGIDGVELHEDENGRSLYDLPGAPVADGDEPAPVRLLGVYDNVWLSHATRDRVTEPGKRHRWMGRAGGLANTVFVDGMLEGLWRVADGRPVVVELFPRSERREQAELDGELARVEQLLGGELN